MSQRSTEDGRSPAETANLNLVEVENQWFKGELALLNAEPVEDAPVVAQPKILRW